MARYCRRIQPPTPPRSERCLVAQEPTAPEEQPLGPVILSLGSAGVDLALPQPSLLNKKQGRPRMAKMLNLVVSILLPLILFPGASQNSQHQSDPLERSWQGKKGK